MPGETTIGSRRFGAETFGMEWGSARLRNYGRYKYVRRAWTHRWTPLSTQLSLRSERLIMNPTPGAPKDG